MSNLPPMLPAMQQPVRKGPVRKGRRKIDIEYIPDKTRRHVTFSKRKGGIMKKAYELATLTGTQVLLLVASETGHVYTFATPKLQPLITGPEGKNLIQSCLNVPDEPNISDVSIGSKALEGGSNSGSDSENDDSMPSNSAGGVEGGHPGGGVPVGQGLPPGGGVPAGGDFKVHPYMHKADNLDDDQSSPEQVHTKIEKMPEGTIPGYPGGSPLPYPSLPQMFSHQMPSMPYPPPHLYNRQDSNSMSLPPHHRFNPLGPMGAMLPGMGGNGGGGGGMEGGVGMPPPSEMYGESPHMPGHHPSHPSHPSPHYSHPSHPSPHHSHPSHPSPHHSHPSHHHPHHQQQQEGDY